MKKIVSYTTVLMVILSLVGCNKNNENNGTSSGNVPDPEGTILYNLKNSGASIFLGDFHEKGEGIFGSYEYRLNCGLNDNNLTLYGTCHGSSVPSLVHYNPDCTIVSLGKANGLGNLNTNNVPAVGWAPTIAAVKGNLYILRYSISWDCNDDSVKEHYENAYYFGLYVVDTILSTENGILGYTVKYCPFTPGKGWNQ